jgi:outer membrane autotransporter protein
MFKPLKTLLATSALVAVASAAGAQTLYSGTSTTQVNLTGASPSATYVTGANYIVTGTAAIVSGSGNAVLNVQQGASVTSSGGSPTINLSGTLALATINNSGTISAVSGSSSAISASVATTAATVNNTGTISGSINLLGANDIVNNQGGTINGAVALGAGNNTLTINSGAVNGAVSAGAGDDTLAVTSGGLLNGNVNLGDGNNTATINASTLAGNLLTGIGNDTLNLTNATVSGSIDLGTGTNVVNISGSTPFATRGTISGTGTLNISNSDVSINHAVTGITNLNSNSRGVVRFNVDTALSGALTSSGTVHIGAGKTVTASTANLSDGLLKVDVASAAQVGRLALTAGTSPSNTRVQVNMLATSNYIASGTTLTVLSGNAAASGTLVNAAQEGVFRYTLAASGSNLVVNVGRVSASSVINGAANKVAADVFERLTIAQTSGTTLANLHGQLNAARTSDAVSRIFESLNPGLSGVGAASLGVTNATGGQISNRLASLRSGVATGSEAAQNHVWAEGFGVVGNQDNKDGSFGYETNGGGITFGADTDNLVEGMNVGSAFSYGKTNVEAKSANSNKTNIDSYVLSAYAGKKLGNDIFVNGQAALGLNKYDLKRDIVGVGTAKASPDGWQASLKGEVGRDYKAGAWKVTPLAGAQYTYLKVDKYTETGVGAAGLKVDPKKLNALDLSLGGRVGYDIDVAGGVLTPVLRTAVSSRVGDTGMNSTNQFIGGGSSFATPGIKADRTSLNVGTGLTFATAGDAEFSADYDAKLNKNAADHAFKLKVRMPF